MVLMTYSLTTELNKRIEENFNSLEEMDQVGIIFIKIVLDEMYIMINFVI